jgi:hypothetical protein
MVNIIPPPFWGFESTMARRKKLSSLNCGVIEKIEHGEKSCFCVRLASPCVGWGSAGSFSS